MPRLKAFVLWSALATGFALTLSGCFLIALNPFFESGKTIYDPALLGSWYDRNCSGNKDYQTKYCTLKIESYELHSEGSGTESGYMITFQDERGGAPSTYVGALFAADGLHFLDTMPEEVPALDAAGVVHLAPGHVVWQVAVAHDELALIPFKNDAATRGPDAMPQVKDVLTAGTVELNAWVTRHARDQGAYVDAIRWKRGAPPAVAPPSKPAAAPRKK